MLSTSQVPGVAQHLRECPHCKREIADLKTYLSELAPPLQPNPLEQVKVLFARLVGDGGRRAGGMAPEPAFGMLRGSAGGPITLEADGILVILDLQPAPEGRKTVLGQVAADDLDRWLGARVELRQNGQLQSTAALDDLGTFRCEGVLTGRIELRIVPGGGPILLADVDLEG
jgi:hypothetical protein